MKFFIAILVLSSCGGPDTTVTEPMGQGRADVDLVTPVNETPSPSKQGRESPVAPVHTRLRTDIGPIAIAIQAEGEAVYRGGAAGLFGCYERAAKTLQCPVRQVLPGCVVGIAMVQPGLLATGNGAEGLFLLDVTRAMRDHRVGHLDLGGAVGRLENTEEHEYVLAAVGHRGLAVLDLDDPNNPQVVGRWPSLGDVRHVIPRGPDQAIAAESRSGVALLDISSPAQPRLLSRLDTDGEARAVTVNGETAFVADFHNGIVSVDLTDPTAIQQLGRLETSASVRDVMVWNANVLIAALGTGGMLVVDISDPSAMRAQSTLSRISPIRFERNGDLLYAAPTGGYPLRIDMSDPLNPQRILPPPRPAPNT